jgi:4-amino-4-deoxy-L-arabinose transferase-like glycosyltransferase
MTRLRRLLGRPEAALFVLVFVGYAYFYQAGGWNQNSRFDLTRAVVERGTARIDRYHKNTGDKARRDGHYYCDKAPGVSWLGVPAYALARAVMSGDGAHPTPRFLADAAFAVTVWSIGIPSALSVLAMCMLLGALGIGLRARLLVSAAYGLATLAFPYSTLLYGHQLSAAMTLAAFALLVRARAEGPRRWVLVAVGALLGGAVVVEYPAALAGVVVGIYAIFIARTRWRAVAWLAAGAALPAIGLALYHAIEFGSPLALPYEFSTQPHRSMGFFMGLGVPRLEALAGILVTPYRGLFFSAPWLALAIPGAVRLWRARRAEAAVSIAIALLFLWLNASLVDWEGGWAMGPRYLVPAIPFLAVLAAGLALPAPQVPPVARRAGWVLAAIAIACSAFLMLVGTAVKPEVPVMEKRPFGNYLLPRFAKGNLAANTQSIDSVNAPPHSAVMAWNLGHRMGLEGRGSLIPLLAVWIACGAWLVLAVRLREQPRQATLDA